MDWPAAAAAAGAPVAREHNATSFMVVQAALAVLLAKLSASTDVAVGFPIAGRGDPALDELVGSSSTRWCCGSIWPGIPPSPSCWPRCGRAALAAYEHQDVPFEVLVDRLNPPVA